MRVIMIPTKRVHAAFTSSDQQYFHALCWAGGEEAIGQQTVLVCSMTQMLGCENKRFEANVFLGSMPTERTQASD